MPFLFFQDFIDLVKSGRLEITTGGWVMADEATTHYYSLLDQLIEGHSWLKRTFNIIPRVSWAIDPFGHSSTMNYLLTELGFKGAVIQRINIGWKQRMAWNMTGDFVWKANWQKKYPEISPMITHNMPFYGYSTSASCGPDTKKCLDATVKLFRNFTDSQLATDIMGEYARSGSLFRHNVVLVPVGNDFSFQNKTEFDDTYSYYSRIINFVNSNPKLFNNSWIQFGTPRDYFKIVKRREREYKNLKGFPTLRGDFFPYSDITEMRIPQYWTGFYSTRPNFKRLGRDMEDQLRATEILYTIAYNVANTRRLMPILLQLEHGFMDLIEARRHLAIFQHHDAITGTSKIPVMYDYGNMLFKSINNCLRLQEMAIGSLMGEVEPQREEDNVNQLKVSSTREWKHFLDTPEMNTMKMKNKTRQFVIYNSLARERTEVVTIRVSSPNIKIVDSDGLEVEIQINPVWATTDLSYKRFLSISETEFEAIFVAKLPPLSLVTYFIEVSIPSRGNEEL